MQSSKDQASTLVGPQRPRPDGSPSTRLIPMRKARSPRTKLRKNLDITMTQQAEVSVVMAKIEGTHRQGCDSCTEKVAERGSVVPGSHDEGHVTYTTTALVEGES